MADGAATPRREPSERDSSPPSELLPLISALVAVMVREERERQKAEATEDAA